MKEQGITEMKKIKVRIKKPNDPVSEGINPELNASQKWQQFIQSVTDTEWFWIRKRLGLLNQGEWLKLMNQYELAQKGNLSRGSK
jgi:hypothetical protein